MAVIRTVEHRDDDVTERVVQGELSLGEIVHELRQFYSGQEPPRTQLVLWDLSQASVRELFGEDARQLAAEMTAFAGARKGGRTAVLVSNDVTFGMSRMYEHHRDARGIELSFQVFRERHEAWAWLTGHRDEPPTGA